MITTTVINIKTDVKVKKQAQKVAADLGLTLSAAINGFLKQIIRDKSISFSLDNEIPSQYLIDSIKEAEDDRKKGDYYSFKSNKEALEFLDKI